MAGLVVLFAVDVVLHPVSPAVSLLFQKFAPPVVFFGAAVLCVMRGRASDRDRSAWWLLALAVTLWGSANLYFALFLWDREVVPIPSVADGLWLAFYLPAYAALYKLLRSRAGSFGKVVWLDGLVGALGVGGASAALVFGVVLDNTEGTALETATNLAYPLGDLGLVALVVAAVTVLGWRASGIWRWIGPAFGIFAIVDSVWLVTIANGTYVGGGLIDIGWPAAGLLLGIAAWRRETRAPPRVRSGSMIVLPTMFGFAAIALLVTDHFESLNPLALGLAAASIAAMLVRLYLTVLENARLLEHSRREATTDPLTCLGNRRQLAADLTLRIDELDPERPLLLTLFDLDGFKHYNDTFGHQAGDQLLQRLSARLGEVMAGRGTAYRMGGDEFCALFDLSDVGEASVATMHAATALSEHGEAFSIGCSYGSALLPTETSDSAEALRLADRRMYIRKRSGRASAGRQSSDVLLRALAERDSDLGTHLDEVADLACATGRRVGVAQEDMEALRQTALLHDVGKVAIPDVILNKPGPLDESEWAFVKRHTVIGERIVSAAPALAPVAKFVRSTHERYDGGGYPDGLAGDGIPLVARVVSVCDAYHAMITKRAYRGARARSSALAELHRCSGAQFDPQVVEAFATEIEAADDVASTGPRLFGPAHRA